jgi:hypothetical protein
VQKSAQPGTSFFRLQIAILSIQRTVTQSGAWTGAEAKELMDYERLHHDSEDKENGCLGG